MKTLYYLATPYSKWAAGITMAFVEASRLTARLIQDGHAVFSPIAHTHPVAVYGNIDAYAHDIWLPVDETMMDRCDVLLVARMAGWEHSRGIKHEIEYFEAQGKPLVFVDPETLAFSPFERPYPLNAPQPAQLDLFGWPDHLPPARYFYRLQNMDKPELNGRVIETNCEQRDEMFAPITEAEFVWAKAQQHPA